MYRPEKVICVEEFGHWMPNTLKKGCLEAVGLTMDIPVGSIGVYNSKDDTYEFSKTRATETSGIRGGQDPSKEEYYIFHYAYYENFTPVIRGEFIELTLNMINGSFSVLQDKPQTTLF